MTMQWKVLNSVSQHSPQTHCRTIDCNKGDAGSYWPKVKCPSLFFRARQQRSNGGTGGLHPVLFCGAVLRAQHQGLAWHRRGQRLLASPAHHAVQHLHPAAGPLHPGRPTQAQSEWAPASLAVHLEAVLGQKWTRRQEIGCGCIGNL